MSSLTDSASLARKCTDSEKADNGEDEESQVDKRVKNINIYGIAVDAHTQNEPRVARSILFALVNALDRYSPLLDNRKRHHLLRIARMFQELGHPWDCEHILVKIGGMYKMSATSSSPFD